MIELFIIFLIILFALLHTPLFAIIAAITIILFTWADESLINIIIEMFRMTTTPTLIAIPLFTFAGYILSESNAPKRIVNLSNLLFKYFRGGLAITTIIVCAIFTAFTGASGITIVAIGGLVYPILTQYNYSKKFSLGLITGSGSIGLLLAPSLPIILYGTISQTSIDKLFIAGIIPCLILITLLSIYSYFMSDKTKVIQEKFSFKLLRKYLLDAIWEIPIPFLILFFILKGVITITEASVFTAFYILLVEFFIKKDLKLHKDFPRILKESMVMVGGILIILAMAMGLTNYLIMEEIPMQLFDFIEQYISNKYAFLLLLNIFLIIVGCMMDIFSAIIVVVPIILPVAQKFDINMVHLGIIFLANLEIGYMTPPVGLNLFIASFRFKKPILDVYKAAIPFIILLLIGLILITYIPSLSLFFLE